MPVADLYNLNMEKVGEIMLSDKIFSAPISTNLMYEVIKMQLANRRAGTASVKSRGEISGSTRKLYRQKGTGRARRGDIKSPILVGGGRAHGPKPKDWSYKIPKKMVKSALRSALSLRFSEKRLFCVDSFEIDWISTKKASKILSLFPGKKFLFLDKKMGNLSLSVRNIPGVKFLHINGLNLFDILNHDTLIVTKDTINIIERLLNYEH